MKIKRSIALAIVTMVVAITAGGCSTSHAARRLPPTNPTMGQLIDFAAETIDDFAATEFNDIDPVAGWVIVPTGMHIISPCGALFDTDAGYCGANSTVYMGETLILTEYGDGGVGVVLAVAGHEFGHHVQNARHGLSAIKNIAVRRWKEVQADCYAGAFTRYAFERYNLGDPLTVNVREFFAKGIQPEDDPGAWVHDRTDARYLQYYVGALNGTFVCDNY